MAVFILDGGLFVGRVERQKYQGGRSYWWWNRNHQDGELSTKDYKEGIHKLFSKDINHMKYKMGTVCDIDKVIVCYDGIYGRRPRGELYKMYKAHKSGIRADKHKGKDIRTIIEDCGFNPMAIDDCWEGLYDEYKEADDLIAEQVLQYASEGAYVVIVSEDKDMLQMLSWEGNIRLHNLREEITNDIFQEKWGIDPHQFVEWKCLAGDVSDNISGLKGIGSKKASKLLQEYGSIEKLPSDYKKYMATLRKWKKLIELPFRP